MKLEIDARITMAPTPTCPAEMFLPAKVCVSAPKRLLNQMRAGKISFEQFQKAATVEYQTFPVW
jgi:hypothetical protein